MKTSEQKKNKKTKNTEKKTTHLLQSDPATRGGLTGFSKMAIPEKKEQNGDPF